MWTTDSWYEEGRAYAAGNTEWAHNYAWRGLELVKNDLAGATDEDVIQRLQAFNQQRLDAVPDLATYPELRGMRELIQAGWRGTRDGAGLTDAELACFVGAFPYYFRYLITGRAPVNCSYIFFPTSDVGPILANNLDSTPEEMFTEPHWPAVNEHLLIGSVSSGVFLDEESPELFPAPVEKLVARYCRTTEEAVEMFTRYNNFWGPANRIIIDRKKTVAIVEKSACRIGVRYSPDGFGFVTAGAAEDPVMHAYLQDRRTASLRARGLPDDCVDTRYWRCSDDRHALMTELLDEARQHPTLETLRQMIQFRDPQRGYVCYNGEVFHPGDPPVEFTLRTSIWLLREGKAQWWAKKGDTPSFENRMPDHEYTDVLTWE